MAGNKALYEQKTQEYIEPILEEFGFYLYDVEYVKEASNYYLRAYIDKEGGITIDDCVEVSRRMNDILDEQDYIDGEYIFEVSSPGLGRTLKKDKHLQMSIGEDVDIHFYKPHEGTKEMTGKLLSFDKDNIELEINNEIKQFLRSEISVVKLTIDF